MVYNEKYKMLFEIIEQKEMIKNIPEKLDVQLVNVISKIKNSDIIYLTGSGTSFHACQFLQILLNKSEINSIAIPASEFHYWFNGKAHNNSLLIIFSQSGESVDAINALNMGKSLGLYTIGYKYNS